MKGERRHERGGMKIEKDRKVESTGAKARWRG